MIGNEQAPLWYSRRYKDKPREESSVADFRIQFRLLWLARKREAGVSVTKLSPPYSEKDLIELRMKGRAVSYLPPEFRQANWLSLMTKILPYEVEPHKDILAESDMNEMQFGWFDYDAGEYPGYLNIPYGEALRDVQASGESGMDLASYFVATADHRYFYGSYLDSGVDKTYTILPQSTHSVTIPTKRGRSRISECPYFVSGDEEGIAEIGRFAFDPKLAQSEEFGIRTIRWAKQPRSVYL